MEGKTLALERALGIIASILAIGSISYAALNELHRGWWDLLFVFTLAIALAWGFVAFILPRFLRRTLPIAAYGMKITSPTQDRLITEERVEVRGSFAIKPDGEWVLLTQQGLEYWPQGDVSFSLYENTWKGGVTLWLPHQTPHTIVLAQVVSPEARCLIEYYRKASKISEKWQSITMKDPPDGFRIADKILVSTKPKSP